MKSKKVAFLFPGQGTQYVGMGNRLAEKFPKVKNIFTEADSILGFPLSRLCFSGPKDELSKTVNTQPAILTTSIAYFQILKDLQVGVPNMMAGHSLGEYSALVAAEALSFESAIQIVRKRAFFTQEAVPLGQGKMAVIHGIERPELLEMCAQVRQMGVVEPAAFNSPEQIVVSGHAKAVDSLMELAASSGARGIVSLDVSAPFHCRLMKSAGEKLKEELDKIEIRTPKIPVIANSSGKIVNSGDDIKNLLVDQVSSPILWQDSIQNMLSRGVNIFVEVGPKKVLSGIVRKICKNSMRLNVETPEALEETVSILENNII